MRARIPFAACAGPSNKSRGVSFAIAASNGTSISPRQESKDILSRKHVCCVFRLLALLVQERALPQILHRCSIDGSPSYDFLFFSECPGGVALSAVRLRFAGFAVSVRSTRLAWRVYLCARVASCVAVLSPLASCACGRSGGRPSAGFAPTDAAAAVAGLCVQPTLPSPLLSSRQMSPEMEAVTAQIKIVAACAVGAALGQTQRQRQRRRAQRNAEAPRR